MFKFDYAKSFNLADKLLNKFGGAGSVVTANMTTPDATQPWIRTNSPVTADVLMCIVPLKRMSFGGLNFGNALPNTVSKATHKALVLWKQGTDIVPDHKLVYQGKTWLVSSATPIKPFDTGILWVCEVWGQA